MSSIVGTILGGVALFGLTGLWTGTISGPANPEFWQQIAPYALAAVAIVLLAVPPTRRVVFGMVEWLCGLRILSRKQRDHLAKQSMASPAPRPALRTSGVPGVYKHGLLSAHRNIQNNCLNVKWISNNSVVGTLVPGRSGGWDVIYDETRESLGWVDSKERGMDLLQVRGLEEH